MRRGARASRPAADRRAIAKALQDAVRLVVALLDESLDPGSDEAVALATDLTSLPHVAAASVPAVQAGVVPALLRMLRRGGSESGRVAAVNALSEVLSERGRGWENTVAVVHAAGGEAAVRALESRHPLRVDAARDQLLAMDGLNALSAVVCSTSNPTQLCEEAAHLVEGQVLTDDHAHLFSERVAEALRAALAPSGLCSEWLARVEADPGAAHVLQLLGCVLRHGDIDEFVTRVGARRIGRALSRCAEAAVCAGDVSAGSLACRVTAHAVNKCPTIAGDLLAAGMAASTVALLDLVVRNYHGHGAESVVVLVLAATSSHVAGFMEELRLAGAVSVMSSHVSIAGYGYRHAFTVLESLIAELGRRVADEVVATPDLVDRILACCKDPVSDVGLQQRAACRLMHNIVGALAPVDSVRLCEHIAARAAIPTLLEYERTGHRPGLRLLATVVWARVPAAACEAAAAGAGLLLLRNRGEHSFTFNRDLANALATLVLVAPAHSCRDVRDGLGVEFLCGWASQSTTASRLLVAFLEAEEAGVDGADGFAAAAAAFAVAEQGGNAAARTRQILQGRRLCTVPPTRLANMEGRRFRFRRPHGSSNGAAVADAACAFSVIAVAEPDLVSGDDVADASLVLFATLSSHVACDRAAAAPGVLRLVAARAHGRRLRRVLLEMASASAWHGRDLGGRDDVDDDGTLSRLDASVLRDAARGASKALAPRVARAATCVLDMLTTAIVLAHWSDGRARAAAGEKARDGSVKLDIWRRAPRQALANVLVMLRPTSQET
mmetsp:Transcript_7938/g.28256  ORF Transcript_7938/g.28256 Transcript_7938/m.28256 type:complete len:782 (-) Transcript_7938:245-2590(-)